MAKKEKKFQVHVKTFIVRNIHVNINVKRQLQLLKIFWGHTLNKEYLKNGEHFLALYCQCVDTFFTHFICFYSFPLFPSSPPLPPVDMTTLLADNSNFKL